MASEERREQVARQIGALMLTYELTEAADVGATVVLAMEDLARSEQMRMLVYAGAIRQQFAARGWIESEDGDP